MEKRKSDIKKTTKDKQDFSKMDNPDMLNTEKESIYDMHDDMKTVDAIPVEELNDKVKDERDNAKTKDTSASERKYK